MTRHGLHHVTAFSGPVRRNLDFYTRVLGLRLVKKTVNFDDPGTYHLYYGDADGTPGSILTFFPIEHAAPGRAGIGETQETGFRVPRAAIGWWAHRFTETGVAFEPPVHVFGDTVLRFRDPDGMMLALVGTDDTGTEAAGAPWDGGIPAEHAIRGFHGVTLLLKEAAPTAAILTDVLGFAETGREGSLIRLSSGAATGGVVTLRAVGGFLPGRPGAGSVHHIAFRAADDAEQEAMAERLRSVHGLAVTEQRDRNYFRSVYFREPGGVLFEIATDRPGFAVDEPAESLGTALKLPAFLEPHRDQIEQVLPKVA
ncbi:ring-cleaving dioxygenase [Methylobacterium organophilum]|uniref:Ring-cleaving dioxygenase MhqO n=1 Tax=Methylobacterium organophilum TaxID=410 RepID=A0ABQ4T651_METOR|nr:ring-cleaving dioxygenase [Methylobacterium organophilum]GJE27150.1 Putative ring-cleaving dioxygenase MhqO [Methylobacterium organophilum]